ncbi:hypothetical protein ASG11_08130 [Sphingomonas sp. Leaf357]|uniref:hypothetical protein n=1 Tax=Sphingomonas sp. Leaf357 TaxID=1736350 RepID=UPI0006F72616|nr:hypothetical protein [Sphingomonas sp. Leaf357]KQS04222.1 hypothetical protein ASG11_08130 [Sphingomonas sp. Leaf357]
MRIAAALVPIVMTALAGCSPQPTNTSNVDINFAAEQAQHSIDNYAAATPAATPTPRPSAVPGPVASPIAGLAPLDPPAPGTPGGLPDDRTPVSEAPFSPDSAQGAANVVQTYYALLGEKKYRQAWALWGHGGQDSGMSADAFAASFDKYSEYHANVGAPGRIDAGMSQRWVTVPVQVYGRLKAGGTPVYMLGSVTLHRVVPGVSDDKSDQTWRLKTADIKPRPKR